MKLIRLLIQIDEDQITHLKSQIINNSYKQHPKDLERDIKDKHSELDVIGKFTI